MTPMAFTDTAEYNGKETFKNNIRYLTCTDICKQIQQIMHMETKETMPSNKGMYEIKLNIVRPYKVSEMLDDLR